jgi:hypothetical protein
MRTKAALTAGAETQVVITGISRFADHNGEVRNKAAPMFRQWNEEGAGTGGFLPPFSHRM